MEQLQQQYSYLRNVLIQCQHQQQSAAAAASVSAAEQQQKYSVNQQQQLNEDAINSQNQKLISTQPSDPNQQQPVTVMQTAANQVQVIIILRQNYI